MPDALPAHGLPQRLPQPADAPSVDVLAARFAARQATVAVLGIGYVGLPLTLALVEAGFTTLALDADRSRIGQLAAGGSPLRHIGPEAVQAALATGRLAVTAAWNRLTEADAVLVCVPTPLGPGREPDLSAVVAATRRIARHLRPGQLIVLESTSYPGTTRRIMQPILEATGLTCGEGFFLAHAPEREDPGNARFRTADIPRVVGGADPASLRLARTLYDAIVARTVPVASPETAEAVKLTENIFRAVNIALVNELKLAFEAMGIDVWEVIEAAATKPFGYMPFFPGPGLGGHCIPVDPHYLTWQARVHGAPARLVELANAINAAMPRHVLDRLEQALEQAQGCGLGGARILVVGIGYKRNLEDLRESPALRLMEMLEAAGAEARYFDPLVPAIPALSEHPRLAGRRCLDWSAQALGACHAAVIVTDHDGVDYAGLAAAVPLILDTRNVCARLGLRERHIVKA